jgi:protein involved in polysaccharide export with SLBB domain
VNKPGLYAVPDGTDLVSLISLAGGPTDDAKLARVVLVRGRESTAGSFTVDLQDFLNSGKRRDVPVLGPGDTVMVPAKFSHNLFRFSGILSVVVLVANVVVTASRR